MLYIGPYFNLFTEIIHNGPVPMYRNITIVKIQKKTVFQDTPLFEYELQEIILFEMYKIQT